MKFHKKFPSLLAVTLALLAVDAHAADIGAIHKKLSNALLCKAKPVDAVRDLVDKGSDFKLGYAASGFGEGMGYRAIVVLAGS
jgi:hypothetical protein